MGTPLSLLTPRRQEESEGSALCHLPAPFPVRFPEPLPLGCSWGSEASFAHPSLCKMSQGHGHSVPTGNRTRSPRFDAGRAGYRIQRRSQAPRVRRTVTWPPRKCPHSVTVRAEALWASTVSSGAFPVATRSPAPPDDAVQLSFPAAGCENHPRMTHRDPDRSLKTPPWACTRGGNP